jgi:hypothetical protein
MTPMRFEGGSGALFGVLHAAAPGTPLYGRAVLLCNPFGQEAVRSHRVFRVMADRFARAGAATLRFDYHGTGESDGDDEEISIERWTDDVESADLELRRRSGCTDVCWMGLRLGASVAAIASAQVRLPPARLILWDAVLDGRRWLADLAADHRLALERAYGGLRVPAHATDDSGATVESVGFTLPDAFRRGVAEIDAATFERVRSTRMAFLAPTPGTPAPQPPAAALRQGTQVTVRTVAASSWNTDEAMNASLVPADVLSAALAELEAP